MPLALCAPGYSPRLGERSNVETFLADARKRSKHGFGVPRFVEHELRGFLRCGVLAHGFVRVRCGACGDELLVGFSCKGRAVCPSCTSRRASDCAAHLVDDVLPNVPVRQWVLTFPRRLRFGLARESSLATKVIGIWLRALESFHRRRAKRDGFPAARGGAVTFAQRFGSALNLNFTSTPSAPTPDDDDERTLRADWEDLADLVAHGLGFAITARRGTALQLRPKARDASVMRVSTDVLGEKYVEAPQGFYLRRTFTQRIVDDVFAR